MLYVWSLEKCKILHSIKSSVGLLVIRHMSNSQFETHMTQICVTGDSLFRTFRLHEGSLKLTHQLKFDQV
jgi:hypothetical protein